MNNLNGLSQITSIGGILDIEFTTNLVNFNGLNNLANINGDVWIAYNESLTTLTGLGSLTSINGGLYIFDNPVLNSMDGLGGLASIGGDFGFYGNTDLTNVNGLGSITSIGGGLYISFNPSLVNLAGLSSLNSIGGGLDISYNQNLISITSLNTIDSIYGGITINENDALTSLLGLENISHLSITNLIISNSSSLSICDVESICDYLAIQGNPYTINGNASGCANYSEVQAGCSPVPYCTSLIYPTNGMTNVSPLATLNWDAAANATGYFLMVGTTPGGGNILNNYDVGNVTVYDPPGNFPFLSTIYVKITPYNANGNSLGCVNESFTIAPQCPSGNVVFTSQAQVDAFAATYPLCAVINGGLQIGPLFSGPTNISNLSGLSSINIVNGLLDIRYTSVLPNLNGLDNITSAGVLRLQSNGSSLSDISALSNITTITSPNDGIFLYSNSGLINLNGLNGIANILGEIRIEGNSSLTSLNGLNSLQSIGHFFTITGNSSLVNLAGLNSLTSIGQYLSISNNQALNNLSGLNNLNSIGSFAGNSLIISSNQNLTSLTGLEGLVNTSGAIIVNQNNILSNLFGINNSISIGGLNIQNNPLLNQCEAQAICDYLAIPSNPATISGNAPGCATRTEVEAACLALPVELLHFSGRNQPGAIRLSWRTATETANDYFAVEHSRDGSQFREIGWVTGHGTSTTPHDYQFEHEKPAPGQHYYRLRQVDFGGAYQYSHTVSVGREIGSGVALWPNPTTGLLQVAGEGTEDAAYRVYDLMGRVVLEGKLQQQIDLSGLMKGVYKVVLNTGVPATEKLVMIE